MNKDELVEKVKQLTDLTNDEKAELIAGLRKKKYGLVWENHPEAVEEHLREYLPVLKEDTTKALTKGGEGAPNHILIEGDNLEALTALTYTHEGKVDVIYIDPPYNTGNKDFVYNDSFVDSEDGYRHSKWLSFMEKRLRIAKKLLSERGAIFISIDDNEQANLKLLCDEVFGSANFVANIIWQKKTGSSDAVGIATITEYVLVYIKKEDYTSNTFSKNKNSFDEKRYKYKDEYFNERGPYYTDSLDRGTLGYYESLDYEIESPEGTPIYPNGRTNQYNDGWRWKWSKEKVEWGQKKGFIEISPSKKDNGWQVKYKIYLNVDNDGNTIERSAPHKNLINDVLNANAAADIKSIFGSMTFMYSKPQALIKKIISYTNSKSSLILDFFAGSGTTLHATMQLNKEDGGHRQCILVTNNENNICEEVTYERNKRVINGYTTPKGEKVEGLHDNNLRYYKVDFVPRDNSLEGMRKLMAGSTDLLCIKHDIYNEEHTFGNLKLRPHIARYFADETGQKMLIIYKVDAIEYFVKEIAQMPEGTQIMVYVFSTNNYAMDADFEEVADKVTLCALPAAIYNAYLKVLPKKKMAGDKEQEEPTLFNGEEDEQ